MTRRLVMGTAGHIDHGKTRLILALTGTDCDRLPEEKARGITIELGFAHLSLSAGATVGVVDVPGHERFVRAMVAGAAGIDFVMLVVAADEGVMPQTREHLAICRLLGIRFGLIALTKLDLVDDDMLSLARADVAELTAGAFLADAPIVPVSAVTGQGLDELRRAIEQTAAAAVQRSDSGILRLPIDRIFTMKGFGTVVTGTCVGGRVTVADEVELLPAGRRVKVRGLQVHGRPVETAGAGQRTAVNLQGVEVGEIPHGSVLVTPETLALTWMIDAETEVLPTAPRPLKRRGLVRLHNYTREVMARAVPLNAEQIAPGENGLVQFRLTEPLVALPGDHFVIRSYSPVATVGGGLILNSRPRKHRLPFTRALADLQILQGGSLEEKAAVHFRQADRQGLLLRHLGPLLGVGTRDIQAAYQKMLSQKRLVRVDAENDLAVDAAALAEIKQELLDLLRGFHAAQPLLPGMSRAELLAQPLRGADGKVLRKALADLAAAGLIEQEGGAVKLAGHRPTAAEDLRKLMAQVAAHCDRAGLRALTLKELQEAIGPDPLLDRALHMLLQENRLLRFGEWFYVTTTALDAAETALVAYLKDHGEIDAQGFKTLFGLTRKWAIPLGEYFDTRRVTVRLGDKRVLRRTD